MSKLNPVDEYLMSKVADPQSLSNRLAPALRSAAIQAGTGLAVVGLPLAASKAYNAIAQRGRYNQMLSHNEDLRSELESNPGRFQQMFKSLNKMSPEFAADPIVAGAYMRQMAANPAGAGKVLVEARTGRTPNALVDAARGMAPGIGKTVAEGVSRAFEPLDPFEEQRQRVQGLELNVKERDLGERLHPPPTPPIEHLRDQAGAARVVLDHARAMSMLRKRNLSIP